ncbi:MAG: hypothetical protein KC484_07430 [Colwelliaceae bacterium]|nr:hypothetical protein [Colwelliaceae bacterium]
MSKYIIKIIAFSAFTFVLFNNINSVYADSYLPSVQEDDWGDDDWGDDVWADEAVSPWTLTGFTEAAYGQFLKNNVVKSSSSLSELRTRIELNYSHSSFELTASGDAIYDNVLEEKHWLTRELNIETSLFSNIDIKLGRQVLTWGTGDYVFLNDLFAKDWQSFFSGRHDEYLKAPSNSVRFTSYWRGVTFDIAWTPEFTPDKYLTGERFSFYSPFTKNNIAPAENFIVNQTNEAQWSARLATTIKGIEYTLYGYKGFWPTPVGINPNGIAYFPMMNAFGASVLTPMGNGIINAEFSYYNSLEDRHGDKVNIANSQIRALVGYEQEIAKSLTLSLQYYLEQTQDYDSFTQTNIFKNEQVDEYRQLVTIRLRYSTLQQKLIYSFFAFYSPTDEDSYIKPSIDYRYDDNLSFSIGANVFLGNKAHTFFGQHESNSNVWLRARFTF